MIKPCPFCHSHKCKIDSKSARIAKDGKRIRRHAISVRCNSCHARGPTVSTIAVNTQDDNYINAYNEAILRWNSYIVIQL